MSDARDAWPECEDFYSLMQAYRWTALTDIDGVLAAYEAVKAWLRAQAEGGTVPRDYASPQEYAARNPLGGIARCFDVMADRLRAGEAYESVIDDYGLCDAAPRASVRPISPEMMELARQAVERQANDKRTEAEIIADGVAFVMGPGGDEGTRMKQPAPPSASEGKPNYDLAGRYIDPAAAPEIQTHDSDLLAIIGDPAAMQEQERAAAAPDAALIAEIDRLILAMKSSDIVYEWVRTLQRCRDRLAQPAITDAEVAACLEPLPDTLAHTYYRAEQMQGVIRRLWDEDRLEPMVAHNKELRAQIARKDKALREIQTAITVPAARELAKRALSDTQEPT